MVLWVPWALPELQVLLDHAVLQELASRDRKVNLAQSVLLALLDLKDNKEIQALAVPSARLVCPDRSVPKVKSARSV